MKEQVGQAEEGLGGALGMMAQEEGGAATAGPPRRLYKPTQYNWFVRYTTKGLKGGVGDEEATKPVTVEERADIEWAMPNEDRTEVEVLVGQRTKTFQEKGGDVETELDDADYMPTLDEHLANFDSAASDAKNLGTKRRRKIHKPSRKKEWPSNS